MKKKAKTAIQAITTASSNLAFYTELLGDIKTRIRHAQTRAALAANAEMVRLYWDIGRLIDERQGQEGWGAGVIPRLANDLHNELPDLKGFSERNLKRMAQFAREYPQLFPIGPRAVAQLPAKRVRTEKGQRAVAQSPEAPIGQPPVAQLPWAHNVLLIQKIKDLPTRIWYMEQTLAQGWSRDTLGAMIKGRAHERQGQAVTNFAKTLPAAQSVLAAQLLKDPYLFDVRHDNREGIADAVSTTLGRRCLSRPTYLKSKDNREHSLLVKRRLTTKCPDHAPRGLRSTVKAILLEFQFQPDLR